MQEIGNKIKMKYIYILFHRNKAVTKSISETLQIAVNEASPGLVFDSVDYKALHGPCFFVHRHKYNWWKHNRFLKMHCDSFTVNGSQCYESLCSAHRTGPEDEIFSRDASPPSGSAC